MSQALDDLNKLSEEFDASFKGDDADLRLDLAEIIWRGLQRKGWSQRRLSQESGLADAVISNIMHGNRNWRCATAARIIHALSTKVCLKETMNLAVPVDQFNWRLHSIDGEINPISSEEHTSGQKITFQSQATAR